MSAKKADILTGRLGVPRCPALEKKLRKIIIKLSTIRV